MAIQQSEKDPLHKFREQVRKNVPLQYQSFDDFCLNGADVPKSTVSRLINGTRTEFRLQTLQKIAAGLGKKLVIEMK